MYQMVQYTHHQIKNILIKYLNLSIRLDKNEWSSFFNYFLEINSKDNKEIKDKINFFKKTKDKDLLKLINKIEKKLL